MNKSNQESRSGSENNLRTTCIILCMRFLKWLTWLFTAEWIFEWPEPVANGGGVVAIRSLFTSILLFLFAMAINPELKWHTMLIHLNWFGTIYAATYVAFYARFASQWRYLADLYNSITEKGVDAEIRNRNNLKTIDMWWAAFIEDAFDLHLYLKKSFANTIYECLGSKRIVKMYIESTENGYESVTELSRQISKLLGKPIPQSVTDVAKLYKTQQTR